MPPAESPSIKSHSKKTYLWLGYGSYDRPFTDCARNVRNLDMVRMIMEFLGFWNESPQPTIPGGQKK